MVAFVLTDMSHLPYFVPLIRAAREMRGVGSTIFYERVGAQKVSSPSRYEQLLKKMAIVDSFAIDVLDNVATYTQPHAALMVNGLGAHCLPEEWANKVSVVVGIEAVYPFKEYIEQVDKIIFPNSQMARHQGTVSSKNRYLGISKYDDPAYSGARDEYLNKYHLPRKKTALIISPREEDIGKVNATSMLAALKDSNYQVVLKSHDEEYIPKEFVDLPRLSDGEWYPDPSMELIKASDVVINYNSKIIEDCVMMNTPLINFHVGPYLKFYEYLYNYPFCAKLHPTADFSTCKTALVNLLSVSHGEAFEDCRAKYLCGVQGTVSRIISEVLG